jgi:flagellar hook-associated protein 2
VGVIQAGVGLASGVNISSMVSQLMSIASEPVTLLTQQDTSLTSQETELTNLQALLTATQYDSDNLGKASVFQDQSATSSNANVLSATVTGTPASGTYQFTPLQTAQAAQWLGTGVASPTSALGAGDLTFRYGPGVDRSASLDVLDGGKGFSPGEIRITDRSGASAVVNLSAAQSINDVVNTINNTAGINVTAAVDGNHIDLTDNTGLTTAKLQVQEVGGGTTAASLGLAGISTASATAEGTNLLQLTTATPLAGLNDGNAVAYNSGLPDISYTLSDGTTGTIDLAPVIPGGSTVQTPVTLGDAMNQINAAAPGKLEATIDPTGTHLVITDLTAGKAGDTATFQLSAVGNSNALASLGINGTPVNGVITGRSLLGGLNSVLLSSLNGGQGLGTLGTLEITDRSGKSASVDLSKAQTLDDVINSINAAGIGVSAKVNQADNGIEIDDTTGSTTKNLVIADDSADGTQTATKLGLAVNAAVSTQNSGDLHLQVVSYNTALSSYNGGSGVAQGTFTITDSNGKSGTINLSLSSYNTIGDVIRGINRLGIGVQAAIDSTGDGIVIEDTAAGSGKLSVTEGNSTTAADLHLLGGTQTVPVNGKQTQVVDGSTTQTIQLGATDSLDDLVSKINTANAGLTASIFNDGSADPDRLELTSSQTGTVGQMVVDASGLGLSLQQTAQSQDAVLEVGGSNTTAGTLATSSTNTFTGVLPGASIQIQQASAQPVTVNVANSDTSLVSSVQSFVSDYNKFRQELNTDTTYNTTTNTGAILTDDPTAFALDSQLSNLLSGQFTGAGSIASLAQLGVTVNTDGTLAFDQSTLQSQYAADPAAVQQFFTQKTSGFSAQMHQLMQQLAGTANSLLSGRSQAINDTVTANQTRITEMNAELSQQQQDLEQQFYNMDLAVSQMQTNMQILDSWLSSSTDSTDTVTSPSTASVTGAGSSTSADTGTTASSGSSDSSTSSTGSSSTS